jgi:PAS domain S-box-containing protein
MGAQMRAHDWSGSSMGWPETWPQWLRSAVSLMLGSKFPMFVASGPDLGFLYNDAYAEILGDKHPAALGQRFQDIWSEIWSDLLPLVDTAMAGEATWAENLPLMMHRRGYDEMTYFTFSYSPVRDDAGAVKGMCCICTETTAKVQAEEALRASEARASGVLEGMTEGFMLLDRNFITLQINAEGLRLEGRPASEIVGRSHWDAYPGSEHLPVGQLYKEVMRERVPGMLEHRYVWPDGHDAWLEVRAYPSLDGVAVFYRDVSERRNREEALREAEARLRRAQEAGGVGLFTVYVADNTLRPSPEFCRLYGLPERDSYPSTAFEELVVPEDAHLVSTAVTRSSGEPPRDVAYRIRRADTGELRWIARKGEIETDEHGRPKRFSGAARDITEQRAAQEALRESEDHFRHAVELNPQVPWTADPQGNITSYSTRWLDLTGQAPDEPLGAGWIKALHPDDVPPTLDRFAAALGSGEPVDVDYRINVGGRGEYRWMRARAYPRRDALGAVMRWYGVVEDIHDRRLAEAHLRASEDQFRVMAQTVPNQVWAGRPDGYLYWFNEQVYAYSGAESGTLDGVTGWTRIIHPDDVPSAAEAWSRSLATGEVYETEFRVRRTDGVYRWFLVRAEPVRSADGSIARWVGTNTDIDERRRHAEELATLNATLEKRVAHRTKELMVVEEALRQSQKMEAVGQLTGGLAHDFNNLLAGISGSLELLQTRMAQGRLTDLDRYINAAQGASKRAAALTHRLLAFSRRQTLDPKPTNVNALVAGMEELVRRTVGPAIHVEVVGASRLWPALVDPPQLENALLNLCINARDAMPDGGRITIETANKWLDERGAKDRDLPPGQYLSLCVSDTGTGMTPEVIERAFDPFFTTKPIGQGTGLGLSMIYGFVRQSGGQVRIYSEVGEGTTMCLYLPRHYGEAEEAGLMASLSDAPRAEQGQTVLVVDDEPTVRMLVTEVLEDLGYTAIEAADGPAALNILRSNVRIDLLVTDVGLPGGMNGRQVADAARVSRPRLKVLFITGYAENAVVGNGHLDPGMAVLTKPFVMEALASRIRELIATTERLF